MEKYIWLISDTHFNHPKIIEYESRPSNYQSMIIDSWKKLVRPCDTIIHLGDVVFDRPSEVGDILSNLPGYKVLVRGNHDKNSPIWYQNKGFHFVCDEFKLNYRGLNLLFTHKPQIEVKEDFCIHGHLHSKTHHLESYGENNILISCELNKYKPVRLDLLINNLLKYDNNNISKQRPTS